MKPLRAILLLAVSTGKQAAALKQSIPEQDERLHEVGKIHDWNIVDVILVPGHSRVYYTYREFAEDALKENIPAPMRMFDHWAKKDFDVFACSSGDRFGREQSIFAEVVGRTIDAGAVVFTLRDGEINRSNRRMFVSMGGYQASVEIDELVRRHRFGMAKNARLGLPTEGHGHILSHVVIGKGDERRTIVNEDARRLFNDIAELLLAGVSWRQMPDQLAERGHFRTSGRKYSASTLRKWLMHPTLHGNAAQHFKDDTNFPVNLGFWVFDPNEPAPDYVTIHYNTHPSIYEGVVGERVRAELRRRFNPGIAKPQPRRKFSGLVVCDRCHYAANYKQDGGWLGLHCVSRMQVDLATHCPNTRYVNEKKLVEAAADLLDTLTESGDWSALYGEAKQDDAPERLAALELEILELKARGTTMYEQRDTVPNFFKEGFEESVNKLAAHGDKLELEYQRLKLKIRDTAPTLDQIQALTDYVELPAGEFWQKPDYEINQSLTRIMGKHRFVIDDGEVTGTTGQPRRYIYTKPN